MDLRPAWKSPIHNFRDRGTAQFISPMGQLHDVTFPKVIVEQWDDNYPCKLAIAE
jgi:hypothetical protein